MKILIIEKIQYHIEILKHNNIEKALLNSKKVGLGFLQAILIDNARFIAQIFSHIT